MSLPTLTSAPHPQPQAAGPLPGALHGLLGQSVTASSDRGIVHQLLVDLGVSGSTAHTVQVYAVGPLRMVLVLGVAIVLSRMVGRLSRRLVESLRLVSPLVRTSARGADRARTLAGVFTSLFRTIIWIIAGMTILAQLDIKLGPFVATATVIGAAVGFGAQTLVKDFLSGVLILAEDQYGVGDTVTVASSSTTGTVESVNLRTTRVRAVDGMVWYVPNGDIRAVGNHSETDSLAIVDVVVPPGTDLEAAGAAAEDEAQKVADEDRWRDVVLTAPTLSGAQADDHEGITLRLVASTRPGRHAPVIREMRLRILDRLRRDELAWGTEPVNA